VTEAHACEQLAQGCYLEANRPRFVPATFGIASERSTVKPHWPLITDNNRNNNYDTRGTRNSENVDKAEILTLEILELRRLKSHLVPCCKIIFDIVHLNKRDLFDLFTTTTRAHQFKIYKRFNSLSFTFVRCYYNSTYLLTYLLTYLQY